MSVRLALWGTRVLTGEVPSAALDRLVAPDVARAQSVRPHVEMWAAFGESVVLVALPSPGNVGLVPRGNTELLQATFAAGECVFVPTMGGALVPHGPDGAPGVFENAAVETHEGVDADEGEPFDVTWKRFDAEPIEAWQLDALSVREVVRSLREESENALSSIHQPWTSRGLRALADAALGPARTGSLGIPERLPPATLKLISDASSMGHAARLGLQMPDDGTLAETGARRDALLRLSAAADTALATGACIAALHLAGLREDRKDDY